MTTTRRLAGATVLGGLALFAAATPAAQQSQDIIAFFQAYDAAFTAKDLTRLGSMYHPEVTVYEGGGINPGWADYRDRHLGPELKAFNELEFKHENVKVQPLGPDAAYVTADYVLSRSVDGQRVTSGGLATYVLIRDDGQWIIRHSHTSARRRPGGGGLASWSTR